MSYREIVELERFRVYKEEAAKIEQPSSIPTSQVEVAMERAISKAEQTLIKKHRAELDRQTKIFFNAGRYAAGARDDTAIKAHDEMLYILGD